MAERGPLHGATLELRIGGPAHGGACVARHEGRAVFVRHSMPGELVRAVVTEDRGGAFCFADAVEVLEAAPGRVDAPCPHSGPGRCGGCDWQHVDVATQRELKATVVREQFARLAGLDVTALLDGVHALPGGALGWRTRIQFALDRSGRPGLHKHRSHELEHLQHCPLGTGDVAWVPDDLPPGLTGVEVVAAGDEHPPSVLGHRPGPGRQARGRRPPDHVELVRGSQRVQHAVLGRDFEVDAAGFWQVHPAALSTFTTALLDAVRPLPGESVLDLYAGAGALTAALAEAVGPIGTVVGLESSRTAVADAAGNLADLPQAEVRVGRVTVETLAALAPHPDVIVLDPPRAGAGREVMQALLDLHPRAIGYVACDPAALARDVAVALAAGWTLRSLQAFDAFPMTHHVECVALLEPAGTTPGT